MGFSWGEEQLASAGRSVLEVEEGRAPALGRLGARLSELERQSAAGALRKVLGELESLRPLAARGEDKIREDVLAALGRRGSEAAAELLEGLAVDRKQPEALRKAAWRAHQRARRALERARQEGSAS